MTTRIEAGKLDGGVFRSEIHTFIRQKVFDKSVADEELIPWLQGVREIHDFSKNGLVIETEGDFTFNLIGRRIEFVGRKVFLGEDVVSVLMLCKDNSSAGIVYRVTYTKA